jgi:acetolactate synthase I/II/III large subunit
MSLAGSRIMSEPTATVGDLIAAFLDSCGVTAVFGVISIHNMPILDAFHRAGRIRFVAARGEAGAAAMADAAARVSGRIGVTVTSTGTAAGNAAGAIIEAQTAGTPLLHLTGQIDSPYLDRNFGFIHEAPGQLAMLKAISKAAFRISEPKEAWNVLREAVRVAMTAPSGPVSVEIPVDVQKAFVPLPSDLRPETISPLVPDAATVDRLASRLSEARRPLIWLGGGARDGVVGARALADLGIGIVSSTAGRGIVSEDHPSSLAAFGAAPAIEQLYGSCDLMLVIGSHLRSNETRTYALKLPPTLIRVDVDPAARGRGYAESEFFLGDAASVLDGLAARLLKRPLKLDPDYAASIAKARHAAEAGLRHQAGDYAPIIEALEHAMPHDALWVRDITLSNSIWGNRAPTIRQPRLAIHAMGGGIGMGLPMAIGASVAAPGRKTVALIGDGGFALNLGELATAVENQADLTILLMNDGGYGVIRNIQDLQYGSRRCYTELQAPNFALMARSLGISHRSVRDLGEFPSVFSAAIGEPGPTLIEIEMASAGKFGIKFGGPPTGPQPLKQ